MADVYFSAFGSKPKNTYSSPLEQGDHPGLDSTPTIDQDVIQRYQSMIGALQWSVSLGRLDMTNVVMTMLSFKAEPRQGHAKKIGADM